MSGSLVQVEGLRELTRTLKAAGESLEDIKDANAAAAQLVLSRARPAAPVESGALAASGKANRAAGRARITFGNARVKYAGPIHWGWPARNIRANTFAVDAALSTEDRWVELYREAVQAIVDTVRGE